MEFDFVSDKVISRCSRFHFFHKDCFQDAKTFFNQIRSHTKKNIFMCPVCRESLKNV